MGADPLYTQIIIIVLINRSLQTNQKQTMNPSGFTVSAVLALTRDKGFLPVLPFLFA